MTTFTITQLANHRALVQGTDSFGTTNKVVLDSAEWDGIKAVATKSTAEDQFNKAVEEFYAPLIEKIDAIVAEEQRSVVDDVYVFSVGETVEHVAAVEPTIYRLSQASAILRLIESGKFDRLVWVGDSLEIIAEAPVATEAPVETDSAE